MPLPLILASSSQSRLILLRQVGIVPDSIIASDTDETILPQEKAKAAALRLSIIKAVSVASKIDDGIILGADTVPVVGRYIMGKAETIEDVLRYMHKLSNRRHIVYTGVCIIKKEQGVLTRQAKVVKTIVKFKKLSNSEIEDFCHLGEGIGKAGGYTLMGYAQSFVSYLAGSFSNVIGLPLYETVNMLKLFGYKC